MQLSSAHMHCTSSLMDLVLICISLLCLVLNMASIVNGIKCHDCKNEIGTCNDGQCAGVTCVKIAAISGESDKMSVQKGCSPVLEETSCVKTDMGGIQATRCACNYDLCNNDKELVRSGLQDGSANSANADRSKRTNLSTSPALGISANYLIMLIFLCLFITGSFSLLIFNTVCVHLCY